MGDAEQVLNDIFGTDSDEEENEAAGNKSKATEPDSDAEAVTAQKKEKFVSLLEEERDSDDEDGDGQDGVEVAAKPRQRNDGPPLDMAAPLLDLPESDKVKMFRQSNILGVESRPFDPEHFYEEEEVFVDGEGTQRVKLKHNIIRWRHVQRADGQLARESNARFVRWSDGSVQLLLGDEVLDMTEQDTSRDQSHLFVRHSGLVQSMGVLKSKLNFRPSGLGSKSHKQLAAIMDKKHAKTAKLRRMITLSDPEKEKEEREKVEEQRNKERTDLQRKQDDVLDRGGYGGGDGYHRRSGGLVGFLEEEEEEFTGMDGARAAVASARNVLSQEDEDARERRILNAKREVPTTSSRKRMQMDDSDDEDVPKKASQRGREDLEDSDDENLGKKERNAKRARNVFMGSDSDSD